MWKYLHMSKLQQRVKTNEKLTNILSRKLHNCTHTNSENGIMYEHTLLSKSPNTLSKWGTQLYSVSWIIFACWFATFCYLLVLLTVSYLFFPNLCATQPYEAAGTSFFSFSRISRQVTCQKKGLYIFGRFAWVKSMAEPWCGSGQKGIALI